MPAFAGMTGGLAGQARSKNIFPDHSTIIPRYIIPLTSRFYTEGCLYSIFRYETGSGGRGMTLSLEMRRGGPAVQAAASWRTGRAPPGPVMAGR